MPITDGLQYELARTRHAEAYAQYTASSLKLKLSKIMERVAELRSQEQPMAMLLGGNHTTRDAVLAALHYAITGRTAYT